MFHTVKLSPSILSADFLNMESDIHMLEESGADWVHVDVMDGHFVPNLTMGVPMVKQLCKLTSMPLDVHLMISNPLTQIPWFLDAGADWVTFHIEAVEGLEQAREAISMVKAAGAKAGISLKPNTPVSEIEPLVGDVDMVLVMSVEPGFSGQGYIEGSEDKVAEVCRIAKSIGADPVIQVDGGIGEGTLGRVVARGADCLVCGNAVFAAEDPKSAVVDIKDAAEACRRETLA